MTLLSAELRAWFKPGLVGVMATVDAQGQPQIVRHWAVRLLTAPDEIEIYVQRASAERCLQNLAKPGRAALNLIELPSYRSRAFKGLCRVSESPVEQAFLEESVAALDRAFGSVGMPACAAQQMLAQADSPLAMVVLRLSVDRVFDQSPKPGAGAPL
jgi:hypothetical protein